MLSTLSQPLQSESEAPWSGTYVVTISPGHTVTTFSHESALAVVQRWARQGVHATFRTLPGH